MALEPSVYQSLPVFQADSGGPKRHPPKSMAPAASESYTLMEIWLSSFLIQTDLEFLSQVQTVGKTIMGLLPFF